MRFLFLILLFPLALSAQKKSRIEIVNADLLEFEKSETRGSIKKLIGRVILKEKDVLLFCDSAFIYDDSSDFEAFSNVRIQRGDSLNIHSDYLFYDKGSKTAELDGNVLIDNGELKLKTKKLFYFIDKKYAHYAFPGEVTHHDFNLTSKQGFYYEELQYATFIKDVKVKGEGYKIIGDTIHYHYNTKKSRFNGPTSIQTDSITGFGHKGYHLNEEDILYLEKNAWVNTSSNYMEGDTLYFDNKNGTGYAKKNVKWQDSSRTRSIYGQHMIYDRKEETTRITEQAIFENILDGDTIFLSADTLYSFKTFVIEYDSIFKIDQIDTSTSDEGKIQIDTTKYLDTIINDTIDTRAIRAHYDVKILHHSISGISDSMIYIMHDSTFRFYKRPILWSDSTQISGDSMRITLKNENIHRLYVYKNTLMANLILENYFYNQIVGDQITGYFEEDSLKRLLVENNAQSIYFLLDDQKRFIGANKGKSQSILVRLKDNNIDQVIFMDKPEAEFLPMRNIQPENINFMAFEWLMHYKPRVMQDLKKPGRYKIELKEKKAQLELPLEE